jgi:hypothetical protein
MIWHMRNMRGISVRIRSIVSGLDALLLLMLNIALDKLDEFLTFCVHPWVVLVIGLVPNFILDMWPYIQEDTSCIFDLFILLMMNLLPLLLRSNLWCGSSLIKLLHYIATVILRRLHLGLLLQLAYLKFKLLDLSLQVIIFFTYSIITSLYKHLFNIRMLALSTKSIKIKIITSFTSFACRGLRSFRVTWFFRVVWPKSIKLQFKILMCLL